MRTKYIEIDERFSIGADPYNFILRDEEREHGRKNSYYSSIEKMVNSFVTRLLKSSLINLTNRHKNSSVRGELGVDDYLLTSRLLSGRISVLVADITTSLKHKLEQLKKDVE